MKQYRIRLSESINDFATISEDNYNSALMLPDKLYPDLISLDAIKKCLVGSDYLLSNIDFLNRIILMVAVHKGKIDAIKFVRMLTGLSLVQSKFLVESLITDNS